MCRDRSHTIDCYEAEKRYGITCPHRRMPNGELRFKLASHDGTAYIRTEATSHSGWQKSHYHEKVRETYIVQRGWMALALWKNGVPVIEKYNENEIVTTEQMIPHNVYLPADAVIHTVKHGDTTVKDWHKYELLNQQTDRLSEESILKKSAAPTANVCIDSRFDSYVNIYNNLDNLIWRIPGFFVAVAAILMAFMSSIVSRPEASLPHSVLAILFFFIGLLFLLGTYSMSRLRTHHSRMGGELSLLEPCGYFHARMVTVRKKWPPSAPHVFMLIFSLLGVIFLGLSYIALWHHSWLGQLVS